LIPRRESSILPEPDIVLHFFYSKKAQKATFLENKGLGLGIMRNDTYANFVEDSQLKFEKDDILILYTDGISEAKNKENEEFGFDRMVQFTRAKCPL
jgi:serine phosphatase RsbU (regulator of sigma subunit)